MVNRELIRSKVLQTCYSATMHGDKPIRVAEQELLLSISKAHEMYMTLLVLLAEIGHAAERMHEIKMKRATQLGETNVFDERFLHNKFFTQLDTNIQLNAWRDSMDDDLRHMTIDMARKIWPIVEKKRKYFQRYMDNRECSFVEDRALYRTIYSHELRQNEELDNAFEELGLYWNDDKPVIDTFIEKTIAMFKEDSDPSLALLDEYQQEADQTFATTLLAHALEDAPYYDELITRHTHNWVLDRIAIMDRLIIHVALAEMLSFPDIPVHVTISEYVLLSLIFSTSASWGFVHGTLDGIASELKAQNKLKGKSVFKKSPKPSTKSDATQIIDTEQDPQ